MSEKLSFQEIVLRLLSFWEAQGCVVKQPYNVQVGAGTMNPATALRVLGPEPWRVVYVEPSIRPDDGRFGQNPNRMQRHHQLQVVLKPDPGSPQELYLQSLAAIGIDGRHHDIRFVEDNWESPVLGAWGRGWEVWLDGQEISQFTYFQQMGGLPLESVAVEITYGLDRIAMALQAADSVWEMDYGVNIAYGQILQRSEIEHSEYYFNVADVADLRAVYDMYEREAARCVAAELALPAYDYNLKCSHIFNILDTRGAVGVAERAEYFRRMRTMTQQIVDLYVAQRQQAGYPLMDAWPAPEPAQAAPGFQFAQVEATHTFLLEIGCEELPVADLQSALRQLQTLIPELLTELRLSYTRLDVEGTPRRLVVIVHMLSGRQADRETVATGPPVEQAFDAEGNPTEAALGFARSKGVPVAALQIQETGDKKYVTAVVHEAGRPAAALLAERLPILLATLHFSRSMRWNHTGVQFSRPIRWLLALYGPDVVPFTFAGVASGRTSRGLRPYDSPEIRISDARNYWGIMRNNGIVLSDKKRASMIRAVAGKLAAEKQGFLPDDEALLTQVANMVERPTPLRGQFDGRFLQLPAEVLVAVMRKHQCFFPVYDRDGSLLPYFIAVRNGDEKHLDVVISGNEKVLHARFADAEFFYHKDRAQRLADFVPKLETMTFQSELGSMLDKTKRLRQLLPTIAGMLALTESEQVHALRAAALAKADLATNLVVEMTALQGIMGGHYARRDGEEEAVAAAIAEQYRPVSRTQPGLALALTDRLDSLVGLFAVGLAPNGSNDPFALRRAALQLLENLIANHVSFDLRVAVTAAARVQPAPCGRETMAAVLKFIAVRLEGMLREQGHAATVVKAVLAAQWFNPSLAAQTAAALAAAARLEAWPALLEAYARCARITRDFSAEAAVQPELFQEAAEAALWEATETAVSRQDGSFDVLIENLQTLRPLITTFFENVLVMDEETAVRHNRLALLQQIAQLPAGIADLSQIEGF